MSHFTLSLRAATRYALAVSLGLAVIGCGDDDEDSPTDPGESSVIAFSSNPAHWRTGARRSLSAKPGTDGRFTFADLPAGEYFLAALTDLDPAEWHRADFLEQVVPAGVNVGVTEGAKPTQDLRIW